MMSVYRWPVFYDIVFGIQNITENYVINISSIFTNDVCNYDVWSSMPCKLLITS